MHAHGARRTLHAIPMQVIYQTTSRWGSEQLALNTTRAGCNELALANDYRGQCSAESSLEPMLDP